MVDFFFPSSRFLFRVPHVKTTNSLLKLRPVCFLLLLVMIPNLHSADGQLHLTLRSRVKAHEGANETYTATEKKVAWDPKKTAIIICDMWDDHWCKSAARRVAELAGPMNDVVKAARARGVFIIHAPSTCTGFYDATPQRQRARAAPFSQTPFPLATAARWGTAWCWTRMLPSCAT